MQRLVLLSGQKSGERRVQRGPLNYTFSTVVFKQRVTLLYEWPVKGSTCVPAEQVTAEKGVSLLSQFSLRRPGHEPQEAGYCFVQWPRSRPGFYHPITAQVSGEQNLRVVPGPARR